MDDKKILKRKAPKIARLTTVRDYLLDLAEQNDIDFVDLDTKYSYQELADKIKKDIDIDVTADQLDDLFTETHFDCGDLGDDVALEFDESLTVTLKKLKKLNERLASILNESEILKYPVKQPTNNGMGIGSVTKVVPEGFYLGVSDGMRINGNMGVTVKPNELYYSYGTSYEGVYKFIKDEQIWKEALARPIDFRGIDYAESVRVFLKNTKRLTSKEAETLINNPDKLNNRSTFGDGTLQVGDMAITKDGFRGKIVRKFHDFGGQLYYRIEDPYDPKGYRQFFYVQVGLDKNPKQDNNKSSDFTYDQFVNKFKNSSISVKYIGYDITLLKESNMNKFKKFLETQLSPTYFKYLVTLNKGNFVATLAKDVDWEIFIDSESLTDKIPEAHKIKGKKNR